MTATITIGAVEPGHRPKIEEIVRATGVFSEAEVAVALEVFDEAQETDMGHGTSDIGAAQALDAQAVPMSPARYAGTRRSPMSGVSKSDYEFVGAFASDNLVGYACFGATPATDRTYDLYWIAVHPNAQRSGAGAALMTEVERRLEERRCRLVVIETSSRDDYAPTRQFYHRRGYAEAARLRDFYAPGDDRVVLSKRLGSGDPGGNVAARPLPL